MNSDEQYYIKVFKTLWPNGYNLTEGGDGGVACEEICKKISEAKKGHQAGEKNPMFGKHHSDETKLKISKVHKGKHISEEQKKKLSSALKGRIMSDEHKKKIGEANKGRHHSEETREKLRQINKGKFVGEKSPRYGKTCEQNGKSKPCRCIETGIVYPCAAEATRQTGITHITDVCLGKRKRAGGYTWEYINKD